MSTEKPMIIANRYKKLDSFNKGGMGEVLIFEDLHLQRKVVLKHLQPGVEARRLLDEQKALLRVRSKHVVQLYDIVDISYSAAVYPAIILEFIDGNNLDVAGYNPDEKYLNVIWQISCGLSDIHSHNIIHRDIKPNNIKIDKEGVVKILDFGLSRSNENANTKSVIGTPIFMAPELWGHETIAFDSSIDVYAYAVTCLTLLTSNVPKELLCHPPVQPSPADFSAAFKGIPLEITTILYKCLSADRAQRPSMDEVKNLLAKHLLRDKHRATVVLNGKCHTLDSSNKKISLNGTVGSLSIDYDGLDFKVSQVTGSVYINNSSTVVGSIVPGCCVLTFGQGANRKFVTFDVSNPEVMP